MEYLLFIPLGYAAYKDYKERIIPDWTWIAISVLAAALNKKEIIHNLIPAGLLFVLTLSIGIFLNGFGGGDVKLITSLALLLGDRIYPLLFFACIIGIAYGIKLYGFKGIKQKNANVPLAVFLLVGYVTISIVKVNFM